MINNLETPILFLTFNRLDTTKRVFEEIKKAKPLKLYIASDGPREDVLGEDEKVKEVRSFIESNIDWECEVKTLFRDKNIGCGRGPSEAITWFFENVEEGIILEDDCLPDKSFFYFCDELLERYRDHENIYMVSGDNFIPDSINNIKTSYYFSNIPHIWGWATWRRAWSKFNFKIIDYPDFLENKVIDKIWNKSNIKKYWLDVFKESYKNELDVWDYQWVYAIWKNNGICIAPQTNLILNIGFSNQGTHTLFKFNKLQTVQSREMKFPLVHPQNVLINGLMDDFINKNVFLKKYRLKFILKKIGLFKFIKKVYAVIKN